MDRALPNSTPCSGDVRRNGLYRLALVLVGVAAFVAASSLLRGLQGPLKAPTLRAQVEAFLAAKDEFDVVFVGSSRIQRGIVPRVIDARLSQAAGTPLRSFNLGIAGMRGFEADWLIRRVLESEPARLRHLVVEAPHFQPEVVPQHDFTARYVDWHDARATWLVLRAIWRSSVSLPTKLELTWRNLRFFAMRSANYATSERFFRVEDPAWDRIVAGWGSLQGYQPLDEKTPQGARRRKRFLRNVEGFEANVEAIRLLAEAGRLAAPGSRLVYDQESLVEQADAIRAAGITPVYLATPALVRGPDFSTLHREGVIEHLIDLRDPNTDPELFSKRNRFDREHMNERGARILSARIADDLAPLVAKPVDRAEAADGPGAGR